MEFTEAYKQSGSCCFSPNARYIAVVVDYQLVIRDTLSFKVVQLFSCLYKISYIEWALDSEYILRGFSKRPMVQAWSLSQPEWTCKIDEGPAGIAYARWSPNSRRILTTSEFQLRLTAWSLNTACVHFLAVGSYDQMLRVLNHLTWKTFAELMHLSTVRSLCCAAVVKEVDEPLHLDMSELCLPDEFLQGNSGLMSWSSDSQYICTRNDSMPTALWIWDIHHLELTAILVQKDPIRAAAWDPTCTRLVL
ncbi:hypothetical protein JCGZ_03875 [Jatropha curcas]|uniref:Anaphase-promoting complex subunit 4 WD40 domain-containing protein n=1 Tax=Jatropha curcas TaxID=180498 RepID=A0A067KW20_JATCU|nr:hypothetical protein JCGZ_03875 [Jatropha curcas]